MIQSSIAIALLKHRLQSNHHHQLIYPHNTNNKLLLLSENHSDQSKPTNNWITKTKKSPTSRPLWYCTCSLLWPSDIHKRWNKRKSHSWNERAVFSVLHCFIQLLAEMVVHLKEAFAEANDETHQRKPHEKESATTRGTDGTNGYKFHPFLLLRSVARHSKTLVMTVDQRGYAFYEIILQRTFSSRDSIMSPISHPKMQMSTLILEWMKNRVRSHLTSFFGHISFMHRTCWAQEQKKKGQGWVRWIGGRGQSSEKKTRSCWEHGTNIYMSWVKQRRGGSEEKRKRKGKDRNKSSGEGAG